MTYIHNKNMSHKENVFRIPVFYWMHVIFLGKIAKGTWKSKKGKIISINAGDVIVFCKMIDLGTHDARGVALPSHYPQPESAPLSRYEWLEP